MKQIEPLGDRLVVKPKPREEKTKGGMEGTASWLGMGAGAI